MSEISDDEDSFRNVYDQPGRSKRTDMSTEKYSY